MNRIKELRESRNIQQKELAIDLGVTQPTISNWELGIKVPSARSTRKLAEYFGVSMDYVIGRENKSEIPPKQNEQPAPKNGDGFEERALRLIRAAGSLSDEQRDFLLAVLELAVERMPRGTPQTERYLPENQAGDGITAPAGKHSNS